MFMTLNHQCIELVCELCADALRVYVSATTAVNQLKQIKADEIDVVTSAVTASTTLNLRSSSTHHRNVVNKNNEYNFNSSSI